MAACAALACKHDGLLGVPSLKRFALQGLRIFVPGISFLFHPPVGLGRGAQPKTDQDGRLSERSEFEPGPTFGEHRRLPGAKRKDPDHRVAFSLVTFFWRSKRKLLAAGQPPANRPWQAPAPGTATDSRTELPTPSPSPSLAPLGDGGGPHFAACAALACKHDRSLGVPCRKRFALPALRTGSAVSGYWFSSPPRRAGPRSADENGSGRAIV